MSSVKNGVVPLVLYCWRVLCILQGAKSYIVGTRYYSTLGATSTLIICDSRGLSAGDDAYEDRDDQIKMVMCASDEYHVSGQQLREGVNGKKTFSFGHCPNYLNPPLP